ncbi:UDP-N-acetylglucosamine 2-epimerase (non-hydrolyzing) [Seongchinamella sediminis]|uniref:UDP-N-acetylglucosamine 2-epimerase (Non-hydrolyzing) n=1 Tax=Seongchinamella sediminis TaxID=2283635 RepID=A0A3L7DY32_9GAMM|nr:UDP-N-acetylglucosamine 2-epimerase (non-hydrolyzing) [Seongchinamella sediminis]RLQ20752.1 UDP-N-acetylglucosamine 2-epimerase (non-hydrolyzing) [Seongchinamella sediminis]
MSSATKAGHVLCVVGARPNFMKIAPIMRAFGALESGSRARLLHTGQHYDAAMKHAFFDQLGIPEPEVDLEVGSGSHTQQTAGIMKRFEPVLDEDPPRAVLVVGDVNSTIACALVAVRKGIPVLHVEAGLRSGDRSMPEEINRILTDQLSDLLFTTERLAEDNLAREGISRDKVHFVGNVMIDTLLYNLERAVPAAVSLEKAGVAAPAATGYGLVTLHRPSNVDNPEVLRRLLETLVHVSQTTPLLFPLHPRTKARIAAAGFEGLLADSDITILPPLGYLEMLGLMKDARLVLTDSGGIQEETTALGTPCITLRESTERPITVSSGTNTVVGTDPDKILACYQDIIQTGGKAGRVPELWDGNAAQRIVRIVNDWLAGV